MNVGVVPGFFSGVRCFFGGLGFLVRTPGSWPLALVPTFIVVLLSSILGFLVVRFVPPLVAEAWDAQATAGGTVEAVASTTLQIVTTVLGLVASFLIAFSLAQPLSGPALEALVRRQEAELGLPTRPETSFVTDIGRSLQSALVGFLIGGPILAVLFLIGLFVPPAQVVTLPLKVLVVVTVLAWDLADYPLSVRGVPIRTRMALLQRHIFPVLGMSAGVALLGLIPCGILLALPIGVAGATRLIAEIEAAEGVRAAPAP